MARERKKKKKTAKVAAKTAERIVAAALAHPTLGADRLARLMNGEGMDVSRGLVYRTLIEKRLQNRKLRIPWTKIKTVGATATSYSWRIPNKPSPTCKVRVTLRSSNGSTIGTDDSDSSFTIQR